jgi:hypothetical protein
VNRARALALSRLLCGVAPATLTCGGQRGHKWRSCERLKARAPPHLSRCVNRLPRSAPGWQPQTFGAAHSAPRLWVLRFNCRESPRPARIRTGLRSDLHSGTLMVDAVALPPLPLPFHRLNLPCWMWAPVGMWAKASISPYLRSKTGEAQPIGLCPIVHISTGAKPEFLSALAGLTPLAERSGDCAWVKA